MMSCLFPGCCVHIIHVPLEIKKKKKSLYTSNWNKTHNGDLRCGKSLKKVYLENQHVYPLNPHTASLFPTVIRSSMLYNAMSLHHGDY